MTDREALIRDVITAWADPRTVKPDLMLTHPDLYWSVARLSAHETVARDSARTAQPKEKHMNREPVVTVASITAAVAALIGLLIAFGVDLSDDQQKAILAVVAVAGPLVAGIVSRSKVTPVSKGI